METFDDRIPPPELRFDRTTRDNGVTCLTVTGEIDMTTGDCFRQTLLAVLGEPGVRRLLLDVAPLRFMDSNGVGVLVKAQRSAEERGVDFGIVNAQGAIRSVLEMLGVYDMLATEP
jgi:anti-sigma B factor antagonist